MIEGGDAIIMVEHEIGAERGEVGELRMGFQPAAEIIRDETRKPALEGRQAGHMALAVLCKEPGDDGERAFSAGRTIKEGAPCVHLQRDFRIAGEEGIAAQMLRAHDAFEQRQVALALEAERQGRGLQADDLACVGFPHAGAI